MKIENFCEQIYGESLCRDVPYKTLLLSVRETAAYVVREMLDKYALTREDPANYCLVQVTGSANNNNNNAVHNGSNNEQHHQQPPPPPNEYILEDDECPLSILMNQTPGTGVPLPLLPPSPGIDPFSFPINLLPIGQSNLVVIVVVVVLAVRIDPRRKRSAKSAGRKGERDC